MTFIREMVPHAAIAAVARVAYNEPYRALSMRHRIGPTRPQGETPELVEYAWRQRSGWGRLRVRPLGAPEPLRPDSEAEFITEHYWGYTPQRGGRTVEYRVEHPRWRVWRVADALLEGDLVELYGPAFARVLAGPPASAFLAEGSPVAVSAPRKLPGVPPR